MKSTLRRGTLVAASAAAAALVVAGGACSEARQPQTGGAGDGGATGATPQNLAIAPSAARVGSDGKVQVDYALADAAGAPVADATGIAANWTLAVVAPDAQSGVPAWQSLITTHVKGTKGETDQPTSETNGTVENLGGGKYRYTYAHALPPGFDPNATYRAGVYARRPIANTLPQQNDIANAVLDFVPAGGTPQPYDAVATQACNRCHGILQAHGGFRRETRLCATCHTTQLVDPDTNDTGDPSQLNPLDFARLVHRLHRGEDLPTVQAAAAAGDTSWKYHVVGFGGSDNVFAATAPNPNTAAGQPPLVATGVAFPQDLRNCAVCHQPGNDAQGHAYASQAATAWKTAPSVRACQACHDDAGFTTASASATYHAPHPGGLLDGSPPLTQSCATCHDAAFVQTIHTAPTASPAFDAFKFQITGVTADDGSAVSASKPVKVAFKVLNGDGSPVTDISGFQGANGRLAVTMSGPTLEYSAANIVTVSVPAAQSATGDYAATLSFPQGATATGTWAAGIEGRRKNATLSQGASTVFDFGRNPVSYFAVGGGTAQPRRQVVATDNCNACHGVLSAHGDLRHDVEYCVMCHTPDNTDAAQRAAATTAGKPILDKLPARTIHFDVLIHRIHTGEDLSISRPFIVYGFGGNPTFLGETRFPGTTAACAKCHVDTTFAPENIPANAAPTPGFQVTASTVGSSGAVTAPGQLATLPATASACLSCHDTAQAQHHVNDMLQGVAAGAGPQGENCAQCHGQGNVVSVTRVHADAAR